MHIERSVYVSQVKSYLKSPATSRGGAVHSDQMALHASCFILSPKVATVLPLRIMFSLLCPLFFCMASLVFALSLASPPTGSRAASHSRVRAD